MFATVAPGTGSKGVKVFLVERGDAGVSFGEPMNACADGAHESAVHPRKRVETGAHAEEPATPEIPGALLLRDPIDPLLRFAISSCLAPRGPPEGRFVLIVRVSRFRPSRKRLG